MNRAELVRRLVLNSISDDYENVDQIILPMVAEDGAKYGFAIERTEIVDALAGLIADGLAKAYLLSSFEPFCSEIDGMPSLDVVEECFKTYFLITAKGKKANLSEWWPFDDEGNPRPEP